MSAFDRIFDMLEEGPTTAFDVVCELGISSKYASALLCELVKIGQAVITGKARQDVGRPYHIYELTP